MSDQKPNDPSPTATQGEIPGERSIASVNAVRSLQSRFTTWLGIGLMGVLAAGLLTWYYGAAFARQGQAREASARGLESRTQGEMQLPPLTVPPALAREKSVSDAVTGAAPAPAPKPASIRGGGRSSAADRTLERQLKGAVFVSLADRAVSRSGERETVVMAAEAAARVAATDLVGGEGGDLAVLLGARPTAAVTAQMLPSQRLLLPRGAFIDCTLETAIDSTLPGMTTCVTATDTFGADGRVVLLERGSKLVGETRGSVRQGGSRLFVLWTEARTPTGVVMPLASSGTDELGRAGMSGDIDRHFWQRFGAALLVSVVDGAVESVSGRRGRDSIVISPTAGRDVATVILRETMRIAPTLRKAQGDRIQVLVARDLDFRTVYRLRVLDTAEIGAAP